MAWGNDKKYKKALCRHRLRRRAFFRVHFLIAIKIDSYCSMFSIIKKVNIEAA